MPNFSKDNKATSDKGILISGISSNSEIYLALSYAGFLILGGSIAGGVVGSLYLGEYFAAQITSSTVYALSFKLGLLDMGSLIGLFSGGIGGVLLFIGTLALIYGIVTLGRFIYKKWNSTESNDLKKVEECKVNLDNSNSLDNYSSDSTTTLYSNHGSMYRYTTNSCEINPSQQSLPTIASSATPQ